MEKIYGHELPSSDDLVEFLKGTGLNPYLSQPDDAGQAAFLATYRRCLRALIGAQAPYFYQLPRFLIWGQKAPVERNSDAEVLDPANKLADTTVVGDR